MNYFVKNIHVNNLYHLKNFDIKLEDEKTPHLIITGKNGSGKTILLNAIADFLEIIKEDKRLAFMEYENSLDYWKKELPKAKEDIKRMSIKNNIDDYEKRIEKLYGKVNLDFVKVADIISAYNEGNFIIAFYQAARKPQMLEPKNPTKPRYELKGHVKDTATNQFLNFLSDLKIQEALARNENQMEDVNHIHQWFDDFENILRQIYQDPELDLKFHYKDYSFQIKTEGKSFKFTELSDGFSAIMDIIADLILKMQEKDSVVRSYQKQGIVLIDEVETHLHLELQKMIMPILTKLFPNIQFIITTHSPFVLNSLENAVAYDLENHEIINELTQYSYEALAEGYFGVSSDSSYMQMQLKTFETLLKQVYLTESEKYTVRQIVEDMDKVPEAVSPNLVGTYLNIKNKYASVLKKLLA